MDYRNLDPQFVDFILDREMRFNFSNYCLLKDKISMYARLASSIIKTLVSREVFIHAKAPPIWGTGFEFFQRYLREMVFEFNAAKVDADPNRYGFPFCMNFLAAALQKDPIGKIVSKEYLSHPSPEYYMQERLPRIPYPWYVCMDSYLDSLTPLSSDIASKILPYSCFPKNSGRAFADLSPYKLLHVSREPLMSYIDLPVCFYSYRIPPGAYIPDTCILTNMNYSTIRDTLDILPNCILKLLFWFYKSVLSYIDTEEVYMNPFHYPFKYRKVIPAPEDNGALKKFVVSETEFELREVTYNPEGKYANHFYDLPGVYANPYRSYEKGKYRAIQETKNRYLDRWREKYTFTKERSLSNLLIIENHMK